MKFLFLFFLLPTLAWGLDATVDFSVEKKILRVEYTLSAPVDSVAFGYDREDRNSFFSNPSLNIHGTKLVLTSVELEDAMTGGESPVFIHDNDNALIYTPFFDLTSATVKGKVKPIQNLTYRFEGKIIHVRNLGHDESFERYLLLLKDPGAVSVLKDADVFFDTDIPQKTKWQEKIEKSLAWLNSKFGAPKYRPVIFFTYSSKEEEWVDGRNVIGGNAIQISVSRGLDPDSPQGLVELYHAIFSHEIAHHWNIHNIDPSGRSGAWIHEGLAEFVAAAMTEDLFSAEMGDYVNFMAGHNLEECETPDGEAQFEYNCGFTIFYKATEGTDNALKILTEIRALPLMTDKAVLSVLAKYSNEKVMEEIRAILKRAPKSSDD